MELLIRGEELFSQGKIEEAECLFLELLKSGKSSATLHNNLGVIAFHRNLHKDALMHFIKALELEPNNEDALANCSNILKNANTNEKARSPLAIPVNQKAKIPPFKSSEEQTPLATSRPKIAVICLQGLESFLTDIVRHLKTKYVVRECYSNNLSEIDSAVRWADIVWLEWANQTAVHVTSNHVPTDGKKLICRLHSYEAFTPFLNQIKWDNLDQVIFVAPHIRSLVLAAQTGLDPYKTSIVPNSVNLNKLHFDEKPRGYHIAYLGHINFKKGPMLLIHAFYELFKRDNRYKLFIGGEFQEPRYKLYFQQMIDEWGLRDHVRFDGWITDPNGWFKDKHFIMCTSVLEGHPVGLMEAMACGLKPAIHNFIGAKQLYPKDYIWSSIPEFVELITETPYAPKNYRAFVQTTYDLDSQMSLIETLMSRLLRKPSASIAHKRSNANPPVINDSITNKQVKDFYDRFLDRLKQDHMRANPRHEHVKRSLGKIIRPEMKVLDIGCGTGITSKFMAELGAHVTAVDISDEMIAFAKKNSFHERVEYFVQDATRLNINQTFDALVLTDSFEHVPRNQIDKLFLSLKTHASSHTLIYLNIPDGRFQRFIRNTFPQKLQIIDEDYNADYIISKFRSIEFEPVQISMYGIDAPVQYNEYVFCRAASLENEYLRAIGRQQG